MNAIGGIKIFKINSWTYWAAKTFEEAILDYRDSLGSDVENPRELTEGEMDSLSFQFDEENTPSHITSFRERLERDVKTGVEFPKLFGYVR